MHTPLCHIRLLILRQLSPCKDHSRVDAAEVNCLADTQGLDSPNVVLLIGALTSSRRSTVYGQDLSEETLSRYVQESPYGLPWARIPQSTTTPAAIRAGSSYWDREQHWEALRPRSQLHAAGR